MNRPVDGCASRCMPNTRRAAGLNVWGHTVTHVQARCAHPACEQQLDDRAQVMQAVQESGFVSRRLFEAAYASKKAALKAGDLSGGRMGPFWDRLVFSKVKARLGGASSTHISGVIRPVCDSDECAQMRLDS